MASTPRLRISLQTHLSPHCWARSNSCSPRLERSAFLLHSFPSRGLSGLCGGGQASLFLFYRWETEKSVQKCPGSWPHHWPEESWEGNWCLRIHRLLSLQGETSLQGKHEIYRCWNYSIGKRWHHCKLCFCNPLKTCLASEQLQISRIHFLCRVNLKYVWSHSSPVWVFTDSASF